MQEFKIKKGFKIFGYMICVIVIGITLYFLVDAILQNNNVLVWIIINLVSILLFGCFFAAIYRGKIVLSDDSIVEYRAFGKKQLLFSEVKGYRTQAIDGIRIILVPKDSKKSRMIVGDLAYLINGSDLVTFLTTKFKDLDELEYNMEVSEAYNNPAIGESIEERAQRIKVAKKVARFFNVGGFIIMICFFVPAFYSYYLLIIALGLLYPLVVLMYFFAQQQILTLVETGKPSIHPNLTVALLFPVGGMGLITLHFSPLNIADCILPVALFAMVLLVLFFLFLKKSKARKADLWMGIFFCLVYSASATGIINCMFDYSCPAQYRAKVLDHWVLSKPTTYSVKLSPWALRKEPTDETVPRATYDKIKNGDEITIYVKKGYLNIPWYFAR